ncbi:MAG TPA: tripartite tricarboxylate transporter substrate binding protein [Burkholderiales bacterium]|nr:tripartite tricarboxylate transporter substrate binding protein [Burkholderiales bacterium]
MKQFRYVIVAGVALLSGIAAAQDYPNRPIRYIVPQAPGGSSDTLARALTQRVGDSLGQTIVIDNRPGATGVIGAEAVARANPDGHTLLQAATSHATNPAMHAKLPYDTVRDFAPISLLSQQPNIWIVTPSLPVKTMKELIAYVKARPGQLNFGSSGTGGSQHLAGELLKSMAGIDMTHIPYKGSPPALIDLLAGRIPIMSSTMPPVLPHLRAGKVRALAVTSARRSSAVPDVPTVAESALPGYEAIAWQGLLAPAGTPRAAIARLQSEFARVLKQPEIASRLTDQGYETVASTPEWFAQYINTEIAKWTKVIRAAGIKSGEG